MSFFENNKHLFLQATLPNYNNGVDILEDRKRDSSPIRVERPVAPNYKVISTVIKVPYFLEHRMF